MSQFRYINPLGRTLAEVKRLYPGWKFVETIPGGHMMFVRRGK
jgi:hypothetical protein